MRHFNVIHHMMEKASAIWATETGINRNPADRVEVKRPDDQRERYLCPMSSAAEGGAQRQDVPAGPPGHQSDVLSAPAARIALTTGMRIAEIFSLVWGDILYWEGLIVVRSQLKGGKIRYAPTSLELGEEDLSNSNINPVIPPES